MSGGKSPGSPGKGITREAAAVWEPVDALVPWERNPRKNDAAVPRVAESIRRFGFVAPVVVWRERGRLVAGHTRLKAMRRLLASDPAFAPPGAPGAGVVPVRYVSFASEAEADAYALADNRLGEIAEWDEPELKAILAQLDDELRAAAGFVDEPEVPELEGEDVVIEPPADPVTKLGDVWVLGRHRLVCGDSTKAETFAALMGEERAALLWTDPPYNVEIVGGNHALSPAERKAKGGKVIQNDAMSDEAFRAFLVSAFAACDGVLAPGAGFYVAHADCEGYNFLGAVRDVGWKFSQWVVWVKDSFVLGRKDYHSRHEPILYGWKLGAAHHAVTDRTQDTVWEIPRPKRSEQHPTMKPPELIERALKNSSDPDAVVLDAFGGSGSTLVACEKTGRQARLVELDPAYCDVIVARWEGLTGKKAHRV